MRNLRQNQKRRIACEVQQDQASAVCRGKGEKVSRQATAAEKKYMGNVSALSCACCGVPGPSQVHHVREGQGIAQRAANWLVIPLCPACHGQELGGKGVHGDKSLLRIYEVDEMSMLATTIQKMVNL